MLTNIFNFFQIFYPVSAPFIGRPKHCIAAVFYSYINRTRRVVFYKISLRSADNLSFVCFGCFNGIITLRCILKYRVIYRPPTHRLLVRPFRILYGPRTCVLHIIYSIKRAFRDSGARITIPVEYFFFLPNTFFIMIIVSLVLIPKRNELSYDVRAFYIRHRIFLFLYARNDIGCSTIIILPFR